MAIKIDGTGYIGSANNIFTHNNGYVGIGTSSPDFPLHVHAGSGSVSAIISATDTTQNQNLWFRSGSDYTGCIECQSSSGGGGFYLSNRVTSGGIYLRTTTSGGSLNSNMVIDSSGRVTKPYQPAFYVGRTGSGNITTDETIPFTDVVVNNGSYFNTSTYRFTAPIAGYYLIAAGGMNNQNNTGATLFRIYKNGSTQVAYFHIVNSHPCSASYSFVYYLNANDYMHMQGQNYHYNTASNGYNYPYFSGYLLG